MSFVTNSTTKKFISEAKALLETGKATQIEIADSLDWDSTALNNVLKGRRNVPIKVYNRFTEIYKPVEVDARTQLRLNAESLIRLDAMSTVILSALAEVLAFQRNQSVTKVTEDLVSTVNSQVKQKLDRL